jgi:hypothetical protein
MDTKLDPSHPLPNQAARRQQQAERLKSLSVASAAATAELQRKLSKAEAVLKLAEVCRRLETEQEKVLPFWSLDEAVPVAATALTSSIVSGGSGGGGGDGEGAERGLAAAETGNEGAAHDQGGQVGQGQQDEEEGRALALAGGRPSIGSCGGGSGGHGGRGRVSAVGLDDEGNEVEEWDYLNR